MLEHGTLAAHWTTPLALLFKIIVTMDNWLLSDPDHVAVIHCVVLHLVFILEPSQEIEG